MDYHGSTIFCWSGVNTWNGAPPRRKYEILKLSCFRSQQNNNIRWVQDVSASMTIGKEWSLWGNYHSKILRSKMGFSIIRFITVDGCTAGSTGLWNRFALRCLTTDKYFRYKANTRQPRMENASARTKNSGQKAQFMSLGSTLLVIKLYSFKLHTGSGSHRHHPNLVYVLPLRPHSGCLLCRSSVIILTGNLWGPLGSGPIPFLYLQTPSRTVHWTSYNTLSLLRRWHPALFAVQLVRFPICNG